MSRASEDDQRLVMHLSQPLKLQWWLPCGFTACGQQQSYSLTVKNNGHIFTPMPLPPASHLLSCKPDEMVVLAKKKKKRHTGWITWKNQHILSSVNFLKTAPFHNDCELVGVRMCRWDISPHGGQTNCVYSIVSAGISGAIKWWGVAVGGHIPCSLIKSQAAAL